MEPAGFEGKGEGVGVGTDTEAAHPGEEEEGVEGGGEEGVGPNDGVVAESRWVFDLVEDGEGVVNIGEGVRGEEEGGEGVEDGGEEERGRRVEREEAAGDGLGVDLVELFDGLAVFCCAEEVRGLLAYYPH